jgi:hypothetical protein
VGNNNFAVTSSGIYFVGPAPGGGRVLEFYSFASGVARKILQLENAIYVGLDVSPDGRSVLYSQREGGGDLMLVENFR